MSGRVTLSAGSNRKLLRKTFTVKVLANGRITIPIRIYRNLGLRPGDELVLRIVGDGFLVTPRHETS